MAHTGSTICAITHEADVLSRPHKAEIDGKDAP